MSREDKFNRRRDFSGQQPPTAPPYYGTFPPPPPPPPPPEPQPATGFPQPVPPPGSVDPPPQYYSQGYQPVPGYPVAEGRPVRQRRLRCCGLGCGWCLFILGFFLAAIPWYAGALILLCSGRTGIDYREKPGLIACAVAAVIATIAIVVGATKGAHVW